jgi:preprotein translocase subunit SecG
MTTFLIVTQIVLATFVTIVVLFQKSSNIGLGAYSGTNESIFGAKGPTPFLSKLTFIFGFLFVANTVGLGYIYNKSHSATVLDSVSIVPTFPTKQIELPTPVIPVIENNSTFLLNQDDMNKTVNNETKIETAVQPIVETKIETAIQPVVETKIETAVQPVVETKIETAVQPIVETKIETAVQPVVETKIETANTPNTIMESNDSTK